MKLRQAHPPLLAQPEPRKLSVPKGAVDTHAHVVGLPPQHPLVEGRSYEPSAASAEQYLAMLDALRLTYGVLVQVSVHGTDNTLMVTALNQHRDRLRGVAVVPTDLPEKELLKLREAGVVGLRLNVLYGGGVGIDQIERYGAIARDFGWHLQFLLDAAVLPEISDRLAALEVPYVIDHYGHFSVSRGVDDPGFRTLLGLLADGAWTKLSGAYLSSEAGFPYLDTIPFARRVYEAAPERCLWGSDWPHVANAGATPTVAHLLDLLADWVPDEAARFRILVDNPHRLYGFSE